MPGNLLTADTNFPNLNHGSMEDRLKAISGYLFMLLEQLRYTLNNLGQENFNSAELDSLGKLITSPLTVRVEGAEKGLAQIIINVEGISSTVQDVSGNVSQLQQTATDISSTVATLGKDFSKVQQNVQGLHIQTSDGKTSISGTALYFRDSNGNIIGRVDMGDFGRGSYDETTYRMIIETEKVGSKTYSLKLESSGNSSYHSPKIIYIVGENGVEITGKGRINTSNSGKGGDLTLYPQTGSCVSIQNGGSGWYRFQSDGLYHNGTRISNSDKNVNDLIDAKLRAYGLI